MVINIIYKIIKNGVIIIVMKSKNDISCFKRKKRKFLFCSCEGCGTLGFNILIFFLFIYFQCFLTFLEVHRTFFLPFLTFFGVS